MVEFRNLHACWHANSTVLRPLHTPLPPSSNSATSNRFPTLFLGSGFNHHSSRASYSTQHTFGTLLCPILQLCGCLFLPPFNRRVPHLLAVCSLCSETNLSRARPWTPGLACSTRSSRFGHSFRRPLRSFDYLPPPPSFLTRRYLATTTTTGSYRRGDTRAATKHTETCFQKTQQPEGCSQTDFGVKQNYIESSR